MSINTFLARANALCPDVDALWRRVEDLREATPSAQHISDLAERRRRRRVPVMLRHAARRAAPEPPPQPSRKP